MSRATFTIPDFIARCSFPLQYHLHGDAIAQDSDDWYRKAFNNFDRASLKKLSMLMAGKLSAYVYNDSDIFHLRASCDLMQLIFHYGDLTDDLGAAENKTSADLMMNALWFPELQYEKSTRSHPGSTEPAVSKLPRDFWLRCVRDASPAFERRFLESFGLFLEARNIQCKHRSENVIPTLEEYIDIRRDSSGLKPLIDFLEYTLQIDIPEQVMEHPIMHAMKQDVNDFCTWTNDIFSFNKEQACEDTYNMVIIFMKQHDMELQEAIDTVGEMCFKALESFEYYKTKLPSWGEDIDIQIARYIKGLENWLIACLHWSYMSGRYFSTEGMNIKRTRIVNLLPLRKKAQ
ncbi:hypothetical protein Clacol_001391 [Clathrus columnatus]|uniref:Terpene synthase n=1 Tax=Clathrus columnatus TaxID=1419009 RepID=A0AAV5A3P1_9AGAM|nr:hypothetical protein Clacol_001391 [Clathrus columnatus]